MKKVFVTSLVICYLSLSGCGQGPTYYKRQDATPTSKLIPVSKNEPKGCEFISEVVGSDCFSTLGLLVNLDKLHNCFRNFAEEKGGNYVWVDPGSSIVTFSNLNTFHSGRVFKCPDPQ